jgi:hypothetical protein
MNRHALAAVFVTGAVLAGAGAPRAATQLGAVEGSVVDAQSGHLVAAGAIRVDVRCGAVKRAGLVDRVGRFRVAALPTGACALTTTGANYAPAALGISVTADAITTVLVQVSTQAYMAKLRADPQQMRKHMRFQFAGAIAADEARGAGAVNEGMAEAVDRSVVAPAPLAAPMAMPPRKAAPRPPMAVPAAAVARPMPATPMIQAPPGFAADPARQGAPADARRARIAGKRAADEPMLPQPDNGWAVVRVFPVPAYTRGYEGPRTDFRETVYWNPIVETTASGDADVAFTTSDAITAFRATAEGFAGGAAGTGQLTFQSRRPLTLDARLPVEATAGDTIRLPVTLTNETDEPLDAALTAQFGAQLRLTGTAPPTQLRVAPRSRQTVVFPLDVVATDGSADLAIQVTARGLADELKKTIRIVPRGFPIDAAASGTAHGGSPARHSFELAGALPGSIRATVTMFPSPVAAMTEGMAGMIREPGGCFEQTSSTNYPNIMILGYLNSSDAADPALIQKTQAVLDHGYKLLTGYETPDKGYEWFGHNPGHEALTAYGLMEFADMAKVYDVDRKMVDRTADWLMSRRDHQGGFLRSDQALDSFGRASPATTNAYIVWALAEAHRAQNLGPELAAQTALGARTADPYLLALAANTRLASAPRDADGVAMARRLAALQAKDGSFPGARETITMSGGESLAIEATALSVMALIKASPASEFEPQIRAGTDWLNTKRGGYGAWGNTQATILGLKALTAYSEHARQIAAPGSATLIVNGRDAGTIAFDKGRREALIWDKLAGLLTAGKNTVELRLDSQAALPYTIAIEYRSAQPASSPTTKISVTTQLLKSQARMGDGVTLRVRVANTTAAGVPMTLARIGLPGGTVFQTWQLKELRDKGAIDFYETRPREVILYWRALPPSAQKDVDLNLLAQVPGTYEAPASSAYLYYTAEDKAWAPSVKVEVEK